MDEQQFHHALDAHVSSNFALARRLIAVSDAEDMPAVSALVTECVDSGYVVEVMLAVVRQAVDFGRCLERAAAFTNGKGTPVKFATWIADASFQQMDTTAEARRLRDEGDG